jgi:hypothetical protein
LGFPEHLRGRDQHAHVYIIDNWAGLSGYIEEKTEIKEAQDVDGTDVQKSDRSARPRNGVVKSLHNERLRV